MDSVSSTNQTTGDNSVNSNQATIASSQDTTVRQTGSSTNTVGFAITTGGDTLSHNTTAGGLSTGDAQLAVAETTKLNTAPVLADASGDPSVNISLHNDATGANSVNRSVETDTSRSSVSITNSGSSRTDVNATVNTGGSTISGNTVVGPVRTGSVRVSINSSTQVNAPSTPVPVIPPPPPATPTPSPSGTPVATPPIAIGGGAGLPEQPTTILAVAPVSSPVPIGGGGAFFTAGSDLLYAQLLLLLAAVGGLGAYAYAGYRRRNRAKLHRPGRSGSVLQAVAGGAVALVALYGGLGQVAAAPSSPTPGPQTAVGPTLPVGPSGTPGPTLPVGPQGTTGPSANATPQASPSPSPAAANQATGPNSATGGASSGTSTTTGSSASGATISNQADATLSTGGNSLSDNTKVGTVSTGDINGTVNIVNTANSTFAPGSSVGTSTVDGRGSSTVALAPSDSRTLLNSQTGAGSSNSNVVQGNNVTRLSSADSAAISNGVAVQADTGDNSLSRNTQVGDVQTGNINLGVNVVNLANVNRPDLGMNVDVWSVLADPNATIVVPAAKNSATGANSANLNTVSSSSARDIRVTRNADVGNAIQVDSNTGGNTATANTAMGGLSTGSSSVKANEVTVANTEDPTFYIVNVFGGWNGSIAGLAPGDYLINYMTGPDSTNTNDVRSTDTVSATLDQSAVARNLVRINATTGGNVLTANSSVGSLHTGSVNVLANVVNFLNSFGGGLSRFSLGILNIFGHPAPAAPSGAAGQGAVAQNPLPQSSTVVTSGSAPVTAAFSAQPAPAAGPTAAGTGKAAAPSWVRVSYRFPAAHAASSASSAAQPALTLASAKLSPSALAAAPSPDDAPDLWSAVTATPSTPSRPATSRSVPLAVPSAFAGVWLGIEALTRRKKK